MSVQTVTMYTVHCDICNVDAFEDAETVAWETADSAEVMALESEFRRLDDGRIVCWTCYSREMDEGVTG